MMDTAVSGRLLRTVAFTLRVEPATQSRRFPLQSTIADQALENLISAYGRRDPATSELLPPEQQDGEIADGMRALLDKRADQSNGAETLERAICSG